MGTFLDPAVVDYRLQITDCVKKNFRLAPSSDKIRQAGMTETDRRARQAGGRAGRQAGRQAHRQSHSLALT